MQERNPLWQPHPDTDAETNIQWKGTEVCLDFRCPCGTLGHFDGDFAYSVRCPGCDQVYDLGTQVIALKTDDPFIEPKELWAPFDD